MPASVQAVIERKGAHILTLDAGTSGLKCSLFHEDGTLIGSAVSEYPVRYPREGWAEQDADWFIQAAVNAVRALGRTTKLDGVSAIGLTGTMNGCVPIDASGCALHANIIHLDTRATGEVKLLAKAVGEKAYYQITGNRPDVHYGLPKMMWLKRHMPDIYAHTWKFVNTKDVLYGFLTGVHGLSDASDASLTGAMNALSRAWDERILSAAGVDINKMPEIRSSADASGQLRLEAARLMGLTPGVPVVIGAGDGPCSTHGSGVYSESGAYLTIGSSAWLAMLTKAPVIDPMMRAFNYADMDDALNTVCGTVQCASTAFDFMANTMLALKDASGGIDFTLAEALAASAPPGAKGLMFLPTLMGERCPWWDADARGMLIGLTLTHTREDIVRAIYEGVAQALHNCMGVLEDNGLTVSDLILSGGGAKSGVWPGMFADMFGVDVRTHATPREATALGAAAAAGVGVGIYKSYADAARSVHMLKTHAPDIARVDAYKAHTRVYRALYAQTKRAMHALARYQRDEANGAKA